MTASRPFLSGSTTARRVLCDTRTRVTYRRNGSAMHLDVGGMVLGVIEDLAYEERSLSVPPDALFVAYSDGLVEPENVYGEEFGIPRLEDAAIRAKGTTPLMVAESLMA